MNKMIKICVWMLLVTSLLAQQPIERGQVSMGVSYQRWANEADDEPIQQTVAPINVFLKMQDNLYLNISNSPATTKYADVKLSGVSDTWIRATYMLPNNYLMFNVGLGMPTGKTELSDVESFFAQYLSESAFQFRLPSYGQGMSMRVGAALAIPYQDKYIFGLGANYTYKTKYKPIATDSLGEYLPGNEVSIFAGVDALLSDVSKIKADIIYSIYGTDEYDGYKIYGSGNKILFVLSYQGIIAEKNTYLSLRIRQKGRNEFWTPLNNSPDSYLKNGNQIEFNAMIEAYKMDALVLHGLLDARIYSKNENQLRDATIFGFGIGSGYELSENTVLQLNLKYLTGQYQSTAVSSVDIYAGLKYQF